MRLDVVFLFIEIVMIADIVYMHSFHLREVWRPLDNMNLMAKLDKLTGDIHCIYTLSAAVRVSPVC
jgi:hypothetical protein